MEDYGIHMALALLCVFPGTMILKYLMDPGDHIIVLMAGGGLLLFYGSFRGIVEGIVLCREKVWSVGEFILFFLIGLPPLLIGGLISMVGLIVLLQKLFGFSPQG